MVTSIVADGNKQKVFMEEGSSEYGQDDLGYPVKLKANPNCELCKGWGMIDEGYMTGATYADCPKCFPKEGR